MLLTTLTYLFEYNNRSLWMFNVITTRSFALGLIIFLKRRFLLEIVLVTTLQKGRVIPYMSLYRIN